MDRHQTLSRRSFVAGIAAAGSSAFVLAAAAGRMTRGDESAGSGTADATASTPIASTGGASSATAVLGDYQTDKLTITVADGYRTIQTVSMPDHDIDATFRYPGTPSAQDLTFRVPVTPTEASSPTFVRTGQVVAVGLDSVVFDPKTAEYYGGRARDGAWNYTPAQLDAYGAHTRPDGFYHQHTVTDRWAREPDTHSALVGWVADGFPLYLRYGYADVDSSTSAVVNLASSYRLRTGSRPSGDADPGGTYDGTFVADYEYVEGLGDLDECNGRWCVTPEFPDGTYAYFLTDQWPYVPNYLRGTPDASFAPGNGGGSA